MLGMLELTCNQTRRQPHTIINKTIYLFAISQPDTMAWQKPKRSRTMQAVKTHERVRMRTRPLINGIHTATTRVYSMPHIPCRIQSH